MRMGNVTALLAVCLALGGCAGTSLLIGRRVDPVTQRVVAAVRLARFVQGLALKRPDPLQPKYNLNGTLYYDRAATAPVDAAECYPIGGGAVPMWRCRVLSFISTALHAPATSFDVIYKARADRFVQVHASHVLEAVRFASATGDKVLYQRAVSHHRIDQPTAYVRCAHSARAGFCVVREAGLNTGHEVWPTEFPHYPGQDCNRPPFCSPSERSFH
jgi:hypothetical protein